MNYMKEIKFRNIAINSAGDLKPRTYFIFEINEEFIKSEDFQEFKGMFFGQYPLIRDDLNIFFKGKIKKLFSNLYNVRTTYLLIENKNNFQIIVGEMKIKGNVSKRDLNEWNISSLRELDPNKYTAEILLVLYDENRKTMEIVVNQLLDLYFI